MDSLLYGPEHLFFALVVHNFILRHYIWICILCNEKCRFSVLSSCTNFSITYSSNGQIIKSRTFLKSTLKGNFGQKRKKYFRCATYRTVAGKKFRSENLKEKSMGPFPPPLSSFFVLTFLLAFLNLCTRLLNFSTLFTKPE